MNEETKYLRHSDTVTSEEVTFYRQCVNKTTNVAFLKVHKAGSTTVMNIFLRFAESNNLNVMLPVPDNYLGFDKTINLDNILPPPKHQSYNILCHHVIYNRSVFRQYMPRDTVFIAIVRDPITQIISAAQFFDLFIDLRKKLGKIPGQQLMTTFLQNPDICSTEEQKFVKTRMCLDFGIPREDLTSKDKIMSHLEILNNDFSLIMVMEMFDESLVLLKRYLCWDMKDIVYVPLNILSRHRDEKVVIEGKDLDNLKKYNWPDFILYEYFKSNFVRRISEEGNDFNDEVKTYKQILSRVGRYCKNEGKTMPGIRIDKTRWNSEFLISNRECEFITKHELVLLDQLRRKYKQKLRQMNS
ncbi:GAL3ST1 [Mytilus coruscus]|uniref:GAL3ST1 n=1 Tax=Mytilus coruscus TaxID=42192 RepID=A0A6J8E2G8_MYTCO|nr:GAL3ST1 [Mytilus coruscus]